MSDYSTSSTSSSKKSNFQIDYTTHLKIRESNQLKLRKDKLNIYLMKSHISELKSIIMNYSDYEIKVDTLQLSNEFISEYTSSNTKLSLALNYLQSADINVVKFALCQLHNHFREPNKANIDRLILPSTINDLISVLHSKSEIDKEIAYEITWLFIQFTTHSNGLTYHIATETVIEVLFGILTSSHIDYCLMNNALILFSHWLADQKLFKLITTHCNITHFIFKCIQTSEKCNFPMEFINNCLRTLYSLINDYSFPLLKKNIEDQLKHIVKFIISDLNHDVFHTALNVIRKVFIYADEHDIADDAIEDLRLPNLIVHHISIDSNEEDVLLTCIDILIDLTYINRAHINTLRFDTEIVPLMQCILEEMTQNNFRHKALLKGIIDLISNFITNGNTMQYLMKDTNVFKYLIDILRLDIRKDDYIGIMKLLEYVMLSNNKPMYLEAIYLEVPTKVILATLNSNKDEESRMIGLNIAEILLAFADDLVIGQNIMKRHFDNIGLSSVIESYFNCNNKGLCAKAEVIWKYFR